MNIELEHWNIDRVTYDIQKISNVSFEQVTNLVSRLDGKNCSQLFIINPQTNNYLTIAGGNNVFIILLNDNKLDASYHLVNQKPILHNDAILIIGKQEAEFSKEVCFTKQQVEEVLYDHFLNTNLLHNSKYQWEMD